MSDWTQDGEGWKSASTHKVCQRCMVHVDVIPEHGGNFCLQCGAPEFIGKCARCSAPINGGGFCSTCGAPYGIPAVLSAAGFDGRWIQLP